VAEQRAVLEKEAGHQARTPQGQANTGHSAHRDQPDTGAGNDILGHIFGQRRGSVEAGVGQATGLQQHQVGKLLMVLAPIVMAALARRQQAHQEQEVPVPGSAAPTTSGPAGLPDILEREAQEAQQRAPTGLGGLLGMLDRDGDGNPLNDIGRIAFGR